MPLAIATAPYAEPVHIDEVKQHLRVTDNAQDARIRRLISGAREWAENFTRRRFVVSSVKLYKDFFPGFSPDVGYWENYGSSAFAWSTVGTTQFYGETRQDVNAIFLPGSPIQAVTAIKYFDTNDVAQTLDPTTYSVDIVTEPARVQPAYNNFWPTTRPKFNAVEIDYFTGFAIPFTVAGNVLTLQGGPPPVNGTVLRLSNSGGTLPAPLLEKTDYYVVAAAGQTCSLALTLAGAAIALADTGNGTHFVGEIPAAIINWMLVRIGSLYENREEVALLNRGKIQELPFVDGLLDPWCVYTF